MTELLKFVYFSIHLLILISTREFEIQNIITLIKSKNLFNKITPLAKLTFYFNPNYDFNLCLSVHVSYYLLYPIVQIPSWL